MATIVPLLKARRERDERLKKEEKDDQFSPQSFDLALAPFKHDSLQKIVPKSTEQWIFGVLIGLSDDREERLIQKTTVSEWSAFVYRV